MMIMMKNLQKFTVILLSVLAFQVSAQVVFTVTAPSNLQGTYSHSYAFGTGQWGGDLTNSSVQGLGVLVDDGTAGDSLGCNALVNGVQMFGNIAFVYRGACEFGAKALNAQNAGAIAVVIINNASGTIAMGAGANGGSVTIPVFMISAEDGALLRAALDAGTLNLFLGSKTGLFQNDIGFRPTATIAPRYSAIPNFMNNDAGDYLFFTGAKVTNDGQQPQSGITVATALKNSGGTSVFDHSANISTLATAASDSFNVQVLDLFGKVNDDYTLTYTANLAGGTVDQFTGDNEVSFGVKLNDSLYSICPFDATTGLPAQNGGSRPSSAYTEFEWGVVLEAKNNARSEGMYFGLVVNAADDLTGITAKGSLYEWNDADQDGTVAADGSEVIAISEGFYDYTSNASGEILRIAYDVPAIMVDGKTYIATIQISSNVPFVATNDDFEADQILDFYPTVIAPFNTDGSWSVGFADSPIPAIALISSPVIGVEENNNSNISLKAYPNPANQNLSIALDNINGIENASIELYDLSGRLVMNEVKNIGVSNVVVLNVANIENGTYIVSVRTKNGVSSTGVVIAH